MGESSKGAPGSLGECTLNEVSTEHQDDAGDDFEHGKCYRWHVCVR